MSNVVALPLAMYELKTPSSIDILFPKMSLNHNGVKPIMKEYFVNTDMENCRSNNSVGGNCFQKLMV